MQNLNWSFLYYFNTVAETKSFTVAAKQLDISNATVSEAVKTLETQLKFKLIERTTRSISLTARGRSLHKKTKAIFLNSQQILNTLEQDNPSCITIGLAPSDNFPGNLDFISKVIEETNTNKYRVIHANMADLEKSLNEGNLDIAITNRPLKGKMNFSIKLFEGEIGLFVHKDFIKRPLSELLDSKYLLFFGDSNLNDLILESLSSEFPDIQLKVLHADYGSLIWELCLQKKGIAVFSNPKLEVFSNKLIGKIETTNIKLNHLTETTYINWPKHLEETKLGHTLKKLTKS